MSYKDILSTKERLILLLRYLPGKFRKFIPGFINELVQSCARIESEGGNVSIIGSDIFVDIKGVKAFLRPRSTDFLVFDQVVLNEEYKPIIDEILLNYNPDTPLLIIDAGANVGFASLSFSRVFPCAKILALEPDSDNFSALKKNTSINLKNDNITPVKIGIWGYDASLKINTSFRDGREWSLNLIEDETENGDIPCYTLDSIMKMYEFPKVDFLKIDIEGGEKNLFDAWNQNGDILKKVDHIAIEIHDEVADRQFINNILTKKGFKIRQIGETTFGIKQSLT